MEVIRGVAELLKLDLVSRGMLMARLTGEYASLRNQHESDYLVRQTTTMCSMQGGDR